MTKFRQRILEMKEGFCSGKWDEYFRAYECVNVIFLFCIWIILHTISMMVCLIYKPIGICISLIVWISYFVFLLWSKAFFITIPISAKIVNRIWGRYGRVVTKDDWKQIKKQNKLAYKFIWDKKNIGHCYMVARILATWIDDAKLMYCSIEAKNGESTAHAVVVKNGCIYCTNSRQHYDFDDYIKYAKAEVYQIWEKEVYCKESFFDDVRQGFVDWCAERNVYCDPQ